jgi:membrane protease YdiL (CAAX protease family)
MPLPPPALVPSAAHAARPRASDIGGVQVLGAVMFTFILASVGVYLLLLPALADPAVTEGDIARLSFEPWFVMVSLIVQDSILAGVALDQAFFRKRLTLKDMGITVQGLAGGVPRQVGLGVLAGALTFVISSVSVQILIDTMRATGTDLGSGGPTLDPRIGSLSDYSFWLVSGAVIAPIAEEVFFRGYALGGFAKRGLENRGLLVTSALFAAVHLNALSFGPLLVAGLVLGSLRLKTGSLVAPVTAHASNNFIVLTLTVMGL